jgi:hypothetical protein
MPVGPMASSVRSLVHLKRNASTSRVLNLHAIWQRLGEHPAHQSEPFFRSTLLNRSIILKHRLRRHERELALKARGVATKVILPIDPTDLSVGGRSFFVGQAGYDEVLKEVASQRGEVDRADKKLLALLDTLPSLDPFLMRERMREHGYAPAQCYFDLSEADTARIYNFLRIEIEPLIGASFGDLDVAIDHKTAKFASKILHNADDAEMEPLRLSLGMSRAEFSEGVFCWKGFVYYKWALNQVLPSVRPVADEIAALRTSDPLDGERKAYVVRVRRDLQMAIAEACRTVSSALDVYDRAFKDLAHNGQPRAFREFLLEAPGMFYALGERLGAVQHIVSFWRFRFPPGLKTKVTSDELIEILVDFEASLGFAPPAQAPPGSATRSAA